MIRQWRVNERFRANWLERLKVYNWPRLCGNTYVVTAGRACVCWRVPVEQQRAQRAPWAR